jgi:hypothetical protein
VPSSCCTVFSISEAELQTPPDTSLPGYDVSSVDDTREEAETLELGNRWPLLHEALGDYDGEHPLAFMKAGGAAFAALDDGPRSSGRYFSPLLVQSIRSAVERLTHTIMRADVRADFERLRTFLHQTAEHRRGIVVHVFM